MISSIQYTHNIFLNFQIRELYSYLDCTSIEFVLIISDNIVDRRLFVS